MISTSKTNSRMISPESAAEALHDLNLGGDYAMPVAGATWIMRSTTRHKKRPDRLVALRHINDFHKLSIDTNEIRIGSMLTHEQLTKIIPNRSDLHVLKRAAGLSANPGVRSIATIGGNISAREFYASDFAPALLCLDASIELHTLAGVHNISIENFLSVKNKFEGPKLISSLTIRSISNCFTAHERLTMRRAGDYPCAIVSVSLEMDRSGLIQLARIAVGSIEKVARRWRRLEQAMIGMRPNAKRAEEAASDLIGDFSPRDSIDAPGWYRMRVLPVLVRRAFTKIEDEIQKEI